ncbi:hypothetical protein AGMMS49936_09910 [Endomicrobiia bacterium]|nr:hypothetical protein AGMMS49936_09910 [Endomicrobiia bacterium]
MTSVLLKLDCAQNLQFSLHCPDFAFTIEQTFILAHLCFFRIFEDAKKYLLDQYQKAQEPLL